MYPIDWLVLAIIIFTIVELVVEVRRKRWLPAIGSGLVAAFLIAVWWRIFPALWVMAFGPTKP